MNKVLILITIIFAIFGYFVLTSRPDLKSQERSGLAEDNLVSQDKDTNFKVPPLVLNDQQINFPHTDDNTNESIIIRSDKDRYTSFAGSDVYFSITNTSDIEEDGILLFHFDQNFKRSNDDPSGVSKPRVQFLEQRADNNWSRQKLIYNNISINATKLARALEKKKDIPKTFDVSAGTQFKLASHQTAYFKAKIAHPPGSEGEFWIETLGENGGYGLLDPWYASTYTHRKQITIDNAMVSGGADLSNFPVLVSINNDLSLKGTDFGGKVASGAGEFVFTSSDGTTKLDHEVEYYSSLDGKIVAWVEVPTLATASDTILYLYFGGPTTGATNQNPTGVWDADYLGVWHLKEDATDEGTASNLFKDSTTNAKSGTQAGSVDITGKIGVAQDFDGTNDSINVGDYDAVDTATALTGCAWVFHDTIADDDYIISKTTGSDGVLFLRDDVGGASGRTDEYTIAIFDSADADSSRIEGATNSSPQRQWTHVCFTVVAGSSTGLRLYINGVEDANSPVSLSGIAAFNAGANVLRFGAFSDETSPLDGIIDEERISDIARSAGWIATEYNNQNAPSTYVTALGAEKEIRTAPDVKFKGGSKIKGGVKIK